MGGGKIGCASWEVAWGWVNDWAFAGGMRPRPWDSSAAWMWASISLSSVDVLGAADVSSVGPSGVGVGTRDAVGVGAAVTVDVDAVWSVYVGNCRWPVPDWCLCSWDVLAPGQSKTLSAMKLGRCPSVSASSLSLSIGGWPTQPLLTGWVGVHNVMWVGTRPSETNACWSKVTTWENKPLQCITRLIYLFFHMTA